MIPLPQHLSDACLTDHEFELAYAQSDAKNRSDVKSCLAILHRLHDEAPSISANTRTWPDAGLCIAQTQKPVPWALIHCPSATHFTHLAAAVMVTRLAYVETCLVVFGDKASAKLLMALEICGHAPEDTFYVNDTDACELMAHMSTNTSDTLGNTSGRLVLLGTPPTAMCLAALQHAIPILQAQKTETSIALSPKQLKDHLKDHCTEPFLPEKSLQEKTSPDICICANLTPSLFMEHTLHVTQLNEQNGSE